MEMLADLVLFIQHDEQGLVQGLPPSYAASEATVQGSVEALPLYETSKAVELPA
jgi:hypothetical protein